MICSLLYSNRSAAVGRPADSGMRTSTQVAICPVAKSRPYGSRRLPACLKRGTSAPNGAVYPKNFITFLAQGFKKVVKPAWRSLTLIMKTIQNLCRQLLEFLRVGQEVILYALIFVLAFFRNRASLGCELVAIRSQLTFYQEGIRQKKTAATTVHPGIPSPVGAAVRGLEWVETCRSLDAAKDGSQLASERFSPVVALEIAGHRRAPPDPPGNARSDPTTQSRK